MKRKRAVVRTSTTKLLNDIATVEDDASIGELEEKLNLLTLKEDSLKDAHFCPSCDVAQLFLFVSFFLHVLWIFFLCAKSGT